MNTKNILKKFIAVDGDCGMLNNDDWVMCVECPLKHECKMRYDSHDKLIAALKQHAEEKLYEITFDEQVDKLLSTKTDSNNK